MAIGKLSHGVKGGLHAAVAVGGKPARSDWRLVRRNTDNTTVVAVIIYTGVASYLGMLCAAHIPA